MSTAWSFGQVASGTLVVLGAGFSQFTSPWLTEYRFANSSGGTIGVFVSSAPDPQTACPGGGCLGQHFRTVPGNSTLVDTGESGFPANYIIWAPGTEPSVRARVFNFNNPAQSVDLPVFRIKTLLALNPNQLAFAIRSDAARTNLALLNVRDTGQTEGDNVTLRIEVYSSEGQVLASRDIALAFGRAAYVVDIGQYLGISNPTGGQVRVTRVVGSGVFWGILPSLNTDGTVSVGLGAVP